MSDTHVELLTSAGRNRERAEWLQFAKLRALRYLNEGDLNQAFASMGSDISKRDDCRVSEVVMSLGLLHLMHNDTANLRSWIEGFN